jgi:hypothetical protein
MLCYSPASIITILKFRRMRQVWHVARVREMREMHVRLQSINLKDLLRELPRKTLKVVLKWISLD